MVSCLIHGFIDNGLKFSTAQKKSAHNLKVLLMIISKKYYLESNLELVTNHEWIQIRKISPIMLLQNFLLLVLNPLNSISKLIPRASLPFALILMNI